MSGTQAPDPRDGPGGLIVMVRDDPAQAARALAADLHAELAIGGAATEAAVGRLHPDQPDDAALARLSAAVRRAEEVRDRTRARIAEQLTATLNTSLAIHPDTLRRAAAELVDARQVVARARRGRHTPPRRRAQRLRVLGALTFLVAGAVVARLTVEPAGVAVAALGLLAGGWSRHADRRAARQALPLLEAVEESARRRWEQVAGKGADPTHVDDAIHRYDPQQRLVAGLVGEHPAVRATEHVAEQRYLDWVRAWRIVVGDEVALADPALSAAVRRADTELWLTDPGAALSVDPGTLVVAAPYADLPDDRAKELHRRLLMLPSRHRVIVVLAPDALAAARPVVDLTDPPREVDLRDGPPPPAPPPRVDLRQTHAKGGTYF